MIANPRIILHQINYSINNQAIISGFDFSFSTGKYGVVGRNGIGKSTLLRLIAGEISPSSGSIQVKGKIAYFSQEALDSPMASVADVLGISQKLQALDRIAQGGLNEQDFALVGDDWLLAETVQRQLRAFNLDGITFDRVFNSLSGGERSRLMLIKALLADADMLILDEPTNNLDHHSRQALYQTMTAWKSGLIVVSHDRELLNLMEHIIEMSSLGIHSYGGNYTDYIEQKRLEQEAAEQTLQAAVQIQQQGKQLTQKRRETHEQARAKGRLARKTEIIKTGRIKSRIELGSAKGRSEKTQRKINLQTERKLSQISSRVEAARSKIEQNREIMIDLPHTQIPKGKMMVEIKNMSFHYPSPEKNLIENFSFTLQGPERIAICGDNGSGKTTFVKLILNQLSPSAGSILLGTDRISYLDQTVKTIDPQLSVLENFILLNPDIRELDARYHLANFLFRNDAALKLGSHLSSGERLRAALACLLMSPTPPQLLILDEPTNHLDLMTIATIESALRKYQGALMVITHDMTFLNNINIQKIITSPFQR